MASHDLKAYKNSKIYCDQLIEIIKVLNLTEKALTRFAFYIPVKKVLDIIKDEKCLLEIHYEKQKKIKETKGQS